MEEYVVWTDGSFKSSMDSGGYSAIITKNNKIIKKLYQGFKNTTNNRMEILGVLETFRYFKEPVKLIVYSDSSYVVNTINNGWAIKWFKSEDLSKKNLDLWFKIVDFLEYHEVRMIWVKGHNNNKMNELADLYAQHAAECINLKEDIVNESSI